MTANGWLPRTAEEWLRWMEQRVREQERNSGARGASFLGNINSLDVVDASTDVGILTGEPDAPAIPTYEGDGDLTPLPDETETPGDIEEGVYTADPGEYDVVGPSKPSRPVVTTRLGTHEVAWDGLAEGQEAMDLDFSYIEVHRSQNPFDEETPDAAVSFRPTRETFYDRLYARGSVIVTGTEYNSVWYYRFVAYDDTGNPSDPSEVSEPVTTVPLVNTDIIDGTLSGAKFMDGTINTAALADGSISASKLAQEAIDEIVSNFNIIDAGGTITTFAPEPPLNPEINRIWYDTNDGNKGWRWDGTDWQPLSSVASAGSGGTTNYYTDEPPPGTDHALGSTWFDTNNGYAPSRWDGTDWVPYVLGVPAIDPAFVDGVNDSLVSVVTEYAVNSSEVTPPASGWSTATPTRTPGTFIWYRVVTTRNDATTNTTAPALLTGNTGPAGAAAATVSLTATAQVLTTPATGGATTPASATVTGTATNTTITAWTYSVDGAAFAPTVPAGVSRTGNVVTVTGASMTARTIAVRMADANGVADTLTVAKVSDGAQGTGGTPGADGYTVLLTNEAHTFPGSETAALAGSTNSTVIAYKGATQQVATVGTITGQVTGLTTSVASNATTAPVITVTVTTALTAQNGTLTVPVTVDGQVFTKQIAWTVTRKGSVGQTGVSVSSVTPYYQQTARGAAAPALPTTNPPPAPWTATEPAYVANTDLWRTDRVIFDNASFSYTAVTKMSAYAAAEVASDLAKAQAIAEAAKAANKVTNPASTNSTEGWSLSTTTGSSIAMDSVTINGATVRAIKVSSNSNTQLWSDIFNMDATKAYEFRVWVYDPTPAGTTATQFYIGHTLYDVNLSTRNVTPHFLSTGLPTTATNNFYAYSTAAETTEWKEFVFYSLPPAAAAPEDFKNLGLNIASNSQHPVDTARGRFRILNWANGGSVSRDLWVTHMTVREVSLDFIRSGLATEAWRVPGTVSINGGAIGADTVTATQIAAGAIIAGKIAADAVTANTIAANAVTAGKIAANAVTAGTVAANAITAGTIAANAVTAGTIAAGAVTADKVAANAITAGKIAADAVTAGNIAAGAVTAGKIAADAVTADVIAAGAVGADEIAANAVVAGKIAANAVTAGTVAALAITSGTIAANAVTAMTIAAGAVAASKISTGELAAGVRIIAGPTAGTHAEVTDLGFFAYTLDPVDGVVREATRMGTGVDDVLAVTDATGETVARIDQTGLLTSHGANIDAVEFDVDGNPTGGLKVYGTEFLNYIRDEGPGRIIAQAYYSANYSSPTISTEMGIAEISWLAEAGRSYLILMNGIQWSWNTSESMATMGLRYTTDGSAPSITSTLWETATVRGGMATNQVVSTPPVVAQFSLPSTVTVRMLMTIRRSYGTGTITWRNDAGTTATHPPRIAVFDTGADVAETWLGNGGGGTYSGGSGGGTGSATPKKTYTSTWTCNNSDAYDGSNAARTNSTDLFHGYWSSNGDHHSHILFTGANSTGGETGKTLAQALTGATITKAEVYLYASHWYYSGGGTAFIRASNATSLTSSTPSGTAVTSSGWPNPGGRWVNITSLVSTATRSVTIGKAGSTSLTYYGRFNSHANSTNKPLLRLTYTR